MSISSKVIAELLDALRFDHTDSIPTGVSTTEIRQRVYEAALRVAVRTAFETNRFGWSQNYDPDLQIDWTGQLFPSGDSTEEQLRWFTNECKRLAVPILALL